MAACQAPSFDKGRDIEASTLYMWYLYIYDRAIYIYKHNLNVRQQEARMDFPPLVLITLERSE